MHCLAIHRRGNGYYCYRISLLFRRKSLFQYFRNFVDNSLRHRKIGTSVIDLKSFVAPEMCGGISSDATLGGLMTLLKPQLGTIEGRLFENPRIRLPLTLFYDVTIPLLPIEVGGKLENTSVRLDFIRFPVRHWRELANHEFSFPVNPIKGYIDGSIYLAGAHNTADATRIAFNDLDDSLFQASINLGFDFTFEGAAPELGRFAEMWDIKLKCDPVRLDALMEEADRLAASR
jgi:hypothetical protein